MQLQFPIIEITQTIRDGTVFRVQAPLPAMTKAHAIRASKHVMETMYDMVLASADAGKGGTPSADVKLFYQRVVARLERSLSTGYGPGAGPDARVRSMDEIAQDMEKDEIAAADLGAAPVEETEAAPSDEGFPPSAKNAVLPAPEVELPDQSEDMPPPRLSVPASPEPVEDEPVSPPPVSFPGPVDVSIRIATSASSSTDDDPSDEMSGPAGVVEESTSTVASGTPATAGSSIPPSLPADSGIHPPPAVQFVTPPPAGDPSKNSISSQQWMDIRRALMSASMPESVRISSREGQKAFSFMAGLFKEVSMGKETIPDDVIRTRFQNWEMEAEAVGRHISFKTASAALMKIRSMRPPAPVKPAAS